MLSADILAEGVRGLVPNPFGIAANKHTSLYMCHSSTISFLNNSCKEVNLRSDCRLFVQTVTQAIDH